MRIKQGTIVRVTGQPGAMDKWPGFFRRLLGRKGVVVGLAPGGKYGPETLTVNMADKGQSAEYINIDREWLTQIGDAA